MKNFVPIAVLGILIVFSISCRKDFSTILSTGTLHFSKDTVFLDTVFTNISSSTYGLKVYNTSKNDIRIPTISLGRNNSFYRLNVDGTPGKSFENVLLRSKDSLWIFIETTIDYSQVVSPLYTDSIVFDAGDKTQDVKLVTLVQDATFIFPNKNSTDTIRGLDEEWRQLRILTEDELNFNNEKPYVIYGYCAVPKDKKLIIEAGTKLYFHEKSALVIQENASLEINGSYDEKVTVEGDRLEPEFNDNSDQWDGIIFKPGSLSEINHAEIKNASIAVLCDSASTLNIKNTKISNHSKFGLWAKKAIINGENLIIGNSRKSSLAIENGGDYNFNHCTIANYWSNSARKGKTLTIDNNKSSSDLSVTFTNSIIDGNTSKELLLEPTSIISDTTFINCFLKYKSSSEDDLFDYLSNNTPTNILDGNLDFKDPGANEFQIGEESDVIDKADPESAAKTPTDFVNTDRTENPDIGAYQHIVFEEEEEEEEEQE